MISVIIPVYNTKDYLKQCIESVLNQSFINLEILLIDDGSTDESGNLCDAYSKEDKRVRVIHQENQGLSSARNIGLYQSKGEFIFFLDSDDWINKNTIEILFNLINKHHADIAIANFCYQYEDGVVHKANNIDNIMILDKAEAMEALLKNVIIKNFAWGKLFKRDLLKNKCFPVGRIFEDIYWTHLVFHEADQIVLSPEVLIYYFQRDNSISYTFNLHKLDILDGYLKRRDFILNYYPDLLGLVDEAVVKIILELYRSSLKHYSFSNHRILVKKLLKVYCEIEKDIEKLDVNLHNDIKLFYNNRKLYVIKSLYNKVFHII